MKDPKVKTLAFVPLIFVFVLSSCSMSAVQSTSAPALTDTPAPTATLTLTPTKTPRPSPTPRPTGTPNLAATQKYEAFKTEAQKYYELGYLTSTDGTVRTFGNSMTSWAQLSWYSRASLGITASDFLLGAHFKWSSAYRNAETSGCGIAFAGQSDGSHYAVFLDRAKVLFVQTDKYYYSKGPVHGSGRVHFANPFDTPVEADFILIVKGSSVYVFVDDELVGEYALSQNKILKGQLFTAILSGTNKDFGTRCEMTNIHTWIPSK